MESTMYGTINNNNNNNNSSGQVCSHFGYGKCKQTLSLNSASPLLEAGFNNVPAAKNGIHNTRASLYARHKPNILFGIYVAGYMMFVFTGAVIYQVLEMPREQSTIDLMQSARVKLLQKYPLINEDLNDFETSLKHANGITSYSIYNGTYESNWTIGKSLFFVGTLLTTIGYGHVTPQTVAGKMFTIAYATLGIPMTLILLSAFVERLLLFVMILLLWLKTKLSHIYASLTIRLIHLAIVLIFMVSLFLITPAIVISRIESDWNYLDSLYYCFISLTTIGLGDYIPGDSTDQQYRDIYKIAITVYLYAGTTLTMLTLAIFYDIPEINIGRMFTPMDLKKEAIDGSNALAVAKAQRSTHRIKSDMYQIETAEKKHLPRTAFNGLDQRSISSGVHAPGLLRQAVLSSAAKD